MATRLCAPVTGIFSREFSWVVRDLFPTPVFLGSKLTGASDVAGSP